MKCPYCNHTFKLTWFRYFKNATGRHTCPLCHKASQLKFRALTFLILMVVCLVCSLPGAVVANRRFGPQWRWLGVLPSLVVVLPLGRLFDDKYKELRALEESGSSDIAECAECHRPFKIENMIAHKGVYVCAGCKPVFLQRLAEGARLPGTAGDKPNRSGVGDE
jgi:hypothetical protein